MMQSAPALLLFIASIVSSALPSVSGSFYGGSSEPREMAYGSRHAYYPRSSSERGGTYKNIAITTHLDHGKTTLMGMPIRLPQGSQSSNHARDHAPDSMSLEKERGNSVRPRESDPSEAHHMHRCHTVKPSSAGLYRREYWNFRARSDINSHPDHGKTSVMSGIIGISADAGSHPIKYDIADNAAGATTHHHKRRANEEMYDRAYHTHFARGSESKVAVVKGVRKQTGLGLKEAKQLVDSPPKPEVKKEDKKKQDNKNVKSREYYEDY